MTDRNRYNRSGRYPRERDERSWRDQEEQFSSERGRQPGYDEDYGEQMSETRAGFRQGQGNYESGWDRDSRYGQGGSGYSRGGGEYRSRLEDDYGPASSYFQGAPGWRHSSFTMEDQNGRDFNAPTSPNYGGYGATGAFFGSGLYEGGAGFRPSYRPSRSDEDGHRGRDRNSRDWFDRAGDEVMSWFGDKDAARRRQMDHRGRGPQNYTRSDDRIREDVNDNLTDDWGVDASNVTVTVNKGEVTLDGTVSTRLQKRRAEDCAEEVSGVKNVQNNLRVRDRSLDRDNESGLGTSTTGSAGSSTKTTS